MPRQRMVHPSIFSDGELWEALPDWGILFYIGLWCEAEDSGCFEGHPGTLANRILPAVNRIFPAAGEKMRQMVTTKDVAGVLKTLLDLGKLEAYTPDGSKKTYYWLVNFNRHQRIDYPTPPKLPLPDFITWHGESEFATGEKGTKEYRPNRRRWHYQVH